MAGLSHQDYRSDIDGLRALAVLSVIVFHIDKTVLPGGFAGVDIFFVISGYLISRNILDDVARGRFSIADFYRRRIKRIAPPMLLVVGSTFVAAQFVLLPEDAERVAESALWSLGSLANAYFWLHQDTSYFAAASNESPLLHLWSLGVEEQFYVVWPLVLMFAYAASRARAVFAVSVVAALASYVLGDLLFTRDPSFVYYMLPTRGGELLVGALVAMGMRPEARIHLPRAPAGVVAALGIALVVGSLGWLSEEGVFPGVRALAPTVGTALLVIAGHLGNNPVSRVFSLRPVVAVGLVSYSAYLWHWPLLAFMRYGGHEPGVLGGAAVVALTLALASVTYFAARVKVVVAPFMQPKPSSECPAGIPC